MSQNNGYEKWIKNSEKLGSGLVILVIRTDYTITNEDVDYVIHAAATKIVPTLRRTQRNVKTNVRNN